MEIKRDSYLEQLKIRKDNGMIKIITGIRRCGKSFLLFVLFKKYLLESGVDNDHIIVDGSLLGTLLAKPKSYPVGMINLLNIYPLTFDEFLDATDKALYAYYKSIEKEQQIEKIFHNRLTEACNNYFIIGGMPECVASWINIRTLQRLLKSNAILKRLLNGLFPQACSTVFTTFPK